MHDAVNAEKRITARDARSVVKQLNREVRHASKELRATMGKLKEQWKAEGKPQLTLGTLPEPTNSGRPVVDHRRRANRRDNYSRPKGTGEQ